MARLRRGVTVEQANAEISAMGRRIHDASSEKGDYLLKDATVVPLKDSITSETRPALLILLGAVGFLLLVACANVANLRLAQASVRERELAVLLVRRVGCDHAGEDRKQDQGNSQAEPEQCTAA